MNKAEFDRFAEEYSAIHAQNIALSGESPDFFAEYKVKDAFSIAGRDFLNSPVRVLDFGSGVGNSVPYFRQYFSRAKLVCLDVSEKSLTFAKQRFPTGAKYTQFDGKRMPFADGSFDLVFSACVFHHISHTEHLHLLRELWRVLSPQGKIVIFEHNPYNPLTLHAVNNCPFDENAVLLRPGLFRRKFLESGFRQVKIKYRIFFPHIVSGLRIVEPFLAWLPLGAQYYISAEKNN